MKVVFNDEFNFVVFLNDAYIDNINFDDKKGLEKYFRQMFSNLHNFYDIEVSGYYDIKVYHDNNYGIVIDLQKDDSDYFDCFNNQIDMRITSSKCGFFLYQVDDYNLISKLKGVSCYIYKNNIYVKVNEKLSQRDYFYLIENANIIYNEDVEKILKYGRKIEKEKGWYNESTSCCTSRKTKRGKINYI